MDSWVSSQQRLVKKQHQKFHQKSLFEFSTVKTTQLLQQWFPDGRSVKSTNDNIFTSIKPGLSFTDMTVMSETSCCVTLGCNSVCDWVNSKIKPTRNLRTQKELRSNIILTVSLLPELFSTHHQELSHYKTTTYTCRTPVCLFTRWGALVLVNACRCDKSQVSVPAFTKSECIIYWISERKFSSSTYTEILYMYGQHREHKLSLQGSGDCRNTGCVSMTQMYTAHTCMRNFTQNAMWNT